MTKKPTSKSPSPKTPQPTTSAASPPSLKKSFDAFLAEANLLPKEKVAPLKVDVNLVFANVQQGILSVQPQMTRLRSELPMLDVDGLMKLPMLAEALLYAHGEAVRHGQPVKRAEMEAALVELQSLRESMLLQAEVLALVGLIPEARVAQIRAGKGLFDAAQDGVALADLYGAYRGQIAGKHPFAESQIARIAELGHGLMKVITPDGARASVSSAAAKAMDERDRIYSLLLQRHGELRRAGYYLFGDEIDEKVPTLGARAGKRREPEAPLPAPAAPEHPAP